MTEEGDSPGPGSEGHAGEGLSGCLMQQCAHRQKEKAESKTSKVLETRGTLTHGWWEVTKVRT